MLLRERVCLTMVLQHYVCSIADGRIAPEKLDGEPVGTFKAPATTAGLQKLYVVKRGQSFCYVGTTSMTMAGRLRVGFKPHTETGYHGYQWRNLKRVDLSVNVTRLGRAAIEATEAELVHLIRQKTGRWPTHQTEIHFHNLPGARGERCRERARRLFERLSRDGL